jgi:ABC-type Fe3+ transport system substrate-binding protein
MKSAFRDSLIWSARLLMDFYLSVEGQRALTRAGKIPARRGIKSPSDDLDRLLDSGNLHVIRTEGEYSRYMKLYNEVLGLSKKIAEAIQVKASKVKS